jgi:hypothetical protein
MPRVTISALHEIKAGAADLLTATRSSNRVITALREGNGNLKLIVWDVANDGAFTRRGDATAGTVDRIAVTDWPGGPGVVTAVRTASGTLKIIAWKLDANGALQRVGDHEGEAIKDVSISSPAGFAGVVTAVVNSSGNLEVIAWKLSASGQFTKTDSLTAGAAAKLDIKALSTAGGAARVAVAMRNGAGNLEIINWSIQSNGQLKRLGEAVAGPISDVALAARAGSNADLLSLSTGADGELTVIGWEVAADGNLTRVSTGRGGKASSPTLVTWHPDIHTYGVGALCTEDGKLKLIVWRNGVELVRHGELTSDPVKQVVLTGWLDGVVTVARDAAGNLKLVSWQLRNAGIKLLRQEWPVQSMSPNPPTPPPPSANVSEPEPHRLAKYGEPAPQPPPGPGDGTDGGAGTSPPWKNRYFPSVNGVDPMLAVGHKFVIATQDHQIAFLGRDGTALPSKNGESTNMSATTFFGQLIAATNPDGTPNQNNINLISPLEIKEFYDTRVTYDPQSKRFVILSAARKQIGTPPPRYIAFAVSKTEDPRDGFYQYMTTESNFRDFPRLVVHNGMVLVGNNAAAGGGEVDTPILNAFDLAALQQFAPDPPNWQYYSSDVDGAVRVFLVLHHGETNGMTCLVDIRNGDPVLRISAFPKPAQPWLAPQPLFAKHTLGSAAGWPGPFGVFRGSTLYLSGSVLLNDRIPNVRPAQYSVRIVRIPFSAISPAALTVNDNGVVDVSFSGIRQTDAPSDLVSCESPHIAVNKNSDVIFVYGRTGIQTVQPLPPEVCYTLWYHNDAKQRQSALLQAGSWQPMWTYKGEQTPTVMTTANKLDYATAVVDPVDDTTFWVSHEYADSTTSSWVTVIGVIDLAAS